MCELRGEVGNLAISKVLLPSMLLAALLVPTLLAALALHVELVGEHGVFLSGSKLGPGFISPMFWLRPPPLERTQKDLGFR